VSKRSLVRFLLAFSVAFVLMLLFRAIGVTMCTVEGNGLEPTFFAGDRVLVNRWSYGLRVGGTGKLFSYGRIGRQEVERGDLVVFENPSDSINRQLLICRCKALPGDTINTPNGLVVVPSLKDCADRDYYWMESVSKENLLDSHVLGFIPEEFIIGRACMVVYSRNTEEPAYKGWRYYRMFLPL